MGLTNLRKYGIINTSNKKGFEFMKQFIKYHLTWIRKKIALSNRHGMNGHGMTYHEIEIIVEVIRYYAPVVVGFGYCFLKDVRKSIMQMRSVRTVYM